MCSPEGEEGGAARDVWHPAAATTAACTWLSTASAPRTALPSGQGADVCVCVCRVSICKPGCVPTSRINMHRFTVRANRRQFDLIHQRADYAALCVGGARLSAVSSEAWRWRQQLVRTPRTLINTRAHVFCHSHALRRSS